MRTEINRLCHSRFDRHGKGAENVRLRFRGSPDLNLHAEDAARITAVAVFAGRQ
jgi:hypothetical protein